MLKRTLLALGPAVWVLILGLWIGPKYDRFVLPAFDGHVYEAMAESPRVFTLAPWGYRILEPWMVHLLPASSPAVGFFWLNLFLLAGVIFAIGSWLRRLGFSSESAALAAAAFAVSPPMRVLLDYQIVVDPLALLFLVVVMSELLEPDLLALMALCAAAALTKEMALLFLTIVPLYLVKRRGLARGLLDSAVVAAPAVALSVLLRLTWGNPVGPPRDFSILDLSMRRMLASGWRLAVAAALSGLVVPALVGMIREKSMVLRVQAALLWIFTFGLILSNPYHYSISDLPRLSAFGWPALLPLALSGLGFKRIPPPDLAPKFPRVRAVAATLGLLTCLAMVAATDPYRRAPFAAQPDPVSLLGRVRESLKTARALEEGQTFAFNSREGRFAEPVAQRFNLTDGRRQRFFLVAGFGTDAVFAGGIPEFRGEARLLVPILVPRTLRMRIEFTGPTNAQVEVRLAGREIASLPVGRGRLTFRIPGNVLVRGDNVLRLKGPAGVPIRLIGFDLHLEPEPRS